MQVPPPSLGVDLVQLLESREGTDITFKVSLLYPTILRASFLPGRLSP